MSIEPKRRLRKQRWVFTRSELRQPWRCNACDEFLAFGEGLDKSGVVVYRNGQVTDRYGDGIYGVLDEHKKLADAVDALITLDREQHEIADQWRDVWVDHERLDCFVSFA